MNTKTQTAIFSAPKKAVFTYLADIENLPRWATGFCKNLRRQGGDYFVETPQGELYFRIDEDERTGVVDMTAGPTKSSTITWPVRVAPLPDETTLLTFTAIQTPEVSDETFSRQCAELVKEFENIRRDVE